MRGVLVVFWEGACILERTEVGRVSSTLGGWGWWLVGWNGFEFAVLLEGKGEGERVNSLVHIDFASSGLNALLLGLGELPNVPVHGVLYQLSQSRAWI